ncbi:MAG: helix-turn-helix domain-containing protein [Sulfuricaulis sp.]|uniref:type II toxin-antitoxin system HigA family antitoxin n=1 Tax=Sulfuricaulis sp. TaxID=2003553 RepID=UPI0034A32447
MLANKMKEVVREYRRLRAVVPLGTLRTKKEYERAVGLLDAILDEIGDDEKHPLAELADAIGVFVAKYEDEHVRLVAAKPAAVLKFLMREHGLRQSDFSEIGTQGVVSEVLAGKRELNTRQIKRLAKRFGVSPAVFI